jgi:hypothetical protein
MRAPWSTATGFARACAVVAAAASCNALLDTWGAHPGTPDDGETDAALDGGTDAAPTAGETT